MRPVLFSIGPVDIQSYTVALLTAFLVVGWLSYREARRRLRLTEDTLLVGSVALLGGVIGAKLSKERIHEQDLSPL